MHSRYPILILPALLALLAPPSGAAEPEGLSLQRIFDGNDLKVEGLDGLQWLPDGSAYLHLSEAGDPNAGRDVLRTDPATGVTEPWLRAADLRVPGRERPLAVTSFQVSADQRRVLIFTNAQQVWRQKTRGDYWVLDRRDGALWQLGGKVEAAELMFATFDPAGSAVAYVRHNNLYVQDLASRRIRALTRDGSEEVINGTGDWVNEEELGIRKGFAWSPDGRFLAYWQFNTTGVARMTLVDNTSERYPRLKRFAYPKAGTKNSACRIGVVRARGGRTRWVALPGDPREHYVPSLSWNERTGDLIVQQLNRLQNTHRVFRVPVGSNLLGQLSLRRPHPVFTDTDEAWVDTRVRVHWLSGGRAFLWFSERDGWRRLYRVNAETGAPTRLSWDDADVLGLVRVDEEAGWIYVMASPENATQRYLYRLALGGGALERVTPADQPGTHRYQVAETGPWAIHTVSTANDPPRTELIELATHRCLRVLEDNAVLRETVRTAHLPATEFLKVDIGDGIVLDAWCLKPPDFDPARRYPLLVYVYGEPAGQTVLDTWPRRSRLWHHYLAQQGVVVVSVDNRGTPAPRGRAWRKCIYRQVGVLAAEDQARAVRRLLAERPYLDPNRVAVWGWSGGGSMTLNAMFRYPELYHAGLAVAFVSDMRNYDTIYQERYMGLPQDDPEAWRRGCPIHAAEHLAGDLLLVYGTGDDNCHYQNCEVLINRLVEHQRDFDLLAYPNRRHDISQGRYTRLHMFRHMTDWLLPRLGITTPAP